MSYSHIEKVDNIIKKSAFSPIFPLTLIILFGFLLRIYFADFDLPSRSNDAFFFLLHALSFLNSLDYIGGQYFMWSGLLAILFSPFNFESYEGYFTIIKVASITISSLSGIVVYLIAKQIMSTRFALLAAAFFVIEPNIIENSIFGMTEPLFILLGLVSLYFAIQKNHNYIPLSFVFAGFATDTRMAGFMLLATAILCCYFRYPSKKQFFKILVIGLIIFFVVFSPRLVYEGGFPNVNLIDPSFIEEKDSPSFETIKSISDNKYVAAGITELLHLLRISVPYLAPFAAFGVLVSFTKLNWQIKLLFAVIIFSLIIANPQYTRSVDFRNLFFITPILSLFAALGIEYLLSNKKIKNILLIGLVLGLMLTSYYFLEKRYPEPALILEQEQFGKFVATNFKANVTTANWNFILHNIKYSTDKIVEGNDSLRELEGETNLFVPNFVIHNEQEFVEFIKDNGINYVIVDENENLRFKIFPDIYFNEAKYEYLDKVFDSDLNDYTKYRVKIFQVDYNKLK